MSNLNLLDLVPPLRRHLKQYVKEADTDSTLAAYLADAIEALSARWTRDYAITVTSPMTFEVDPDIAIADKRTIIVMASLIYKMGNVSLASFRDGDFAYDPTQGRVNPISLDAEELGRTLGTAQRLAIATTAPLHGYASIWNPDTYSYIMRLGLR